MVVIPLFKVYMSNHAHEAVKDVLESGYIGEGDTVKEFESCVGNFLLSDYVASTNSGTSALHLALRLVNDNFDKDTEVLTTPLTCFATNAPILANGYKIKWVDVDKFNLNMDLDDLERKLSPNTKIIMVMHWGGMPTDLDRIKEIQNKCFDMYGFKPVVIEDCAHSFGSKFGGKYLGSHGNVCCFSFQAIKHLTCGDGGCIVSPNSDLHKRAKLLRWYGMDREGSQELRCYNDFNEWGYKFHMNNINAAIGLENIEDIDWILGKHIDNAKYYNEHLTGVDNSANFVPVNNVSASWIYTLLVDNEHDFDRKMKEHGIHTNHVHERNDRYTCVKDFKTSLPTLDSLDNRISCIPVGWWVSNENREYIVDKIKEGW